MRPVPLLLSIVSTSFARAGPVIRSGLAPPYSEIVEPDASLAPNATNRFLDLHDLLAVLNMASSPWASPSKGTCEVICLTRSDSSINPGMQQYQFNHQVACAPNCTPLASTGGDWPIIPADTDHTYTSHRANSTAIMNGDFMTMYGDVPVDSKSHKIQDPYSLVRFSNIRTRGNDYSQSLRDLVPSKRERKRSKGSTDTSRLGVGFGVALQVEQICPDGALETKTTEGRWTCQKSPGLDETWSAVVVDPYTVGAFNPAWMRQGPIANKDGTEAGTCELS